MPSRIFSQSAVVLFDAAPSMAELTQALGSFSIAKSIEPTDTHWIGGPGVVVAMRPDVNGYLIVDVIDKPWPDHMGDSSSEPELLAAWSLGQFGPHVFPGGLARAVSQARQIEPKSTVRAHEHRAFVRIKSTYVLGADKDLALRPPDYNAVDELLFVSRVASALLDAPGASFYFNPNGETLHSAASLRQALAHHDEGLVPLPAWSNVRMYMPEGAEDWLLMDTVGMEQLGGIDHEACVPPEGVKPGEVAAFLRNAALYTLEHGPIIREGDTIEGPGGNWLAHLDDQSCAPPPRPVRRWRPVDAEPPPPCFRFPGEGKPRRWKLFKGGR